MVELHAVSSVIIWNFPYRTGPRSADYQMRHGLILAQSQAKGWYLEEHNAGSIPEELLGVESGSSEN